MAGSGRTAALIRKFRLGRSAVALSVLAASLVPVAQASAAVTSGPSRDASPIGMCLACAPSMIVAATLTAS